MTPQIVNTQSAGWNGTGLRLITSPVVWPLNSSAFARKLTAITTSSPMALISGQVQLRSRAGGGVTTVVCGATGDGRVSGCSTVSVGGACRDGRLSGCSLG